MRWAVVVLVVGLGVLAYAFGLRFGYLSLTPSWMYNAQGTNGYSYQLADAGDTLTLAGSCRTYAGRATLLLFRPDGSRADGQQCIKGNYRLSLRGGGGVGFYKLRVRLDHFTGRLEIGEERGGPNFQP